ncbi:MAG: 4-hydroxy-tetrahydrodipicolinate reductase, partial [Deltaproteobacteria bacterium]|nr:4-hydroxy-tetrahydrodipicolinate reductase [Deltaproteobacteria bacterium]
ELHHDGKVDAPSGTAIKTANLLAESRSSVPQKIADKEIISGARGANAENIRVHSVRLPGLVAHQEVIFGGQSQTLTIRHDSIHRDSFMPGVCLACKKVMDLNELVYGLEHLI